MPLLQGADAVGLLQERGQIGLKALESHVQMPVIPAQAHLVLCLQLLAVGR